MNHRQKKILAQSAFVIIITVMATFLMANVKDLINRSEAMKGMEHLGEKILEYKANNGSRPSENMLESFYTQIPNMVRLGKVNYRAIWIEPDADEGTEILAYIKKQYKSLFMKDGYIVLYCSGAVEWRHQREFESLLEEQQGTMEKSITKN